MYDKYIPAFEYILEQFNLSDSYFIPIDWDGAPLIKEAVLELKRLGYTKGPNAIGSLSFTIDPEGIEFLKEIVG